MASVDISQLRNVTSDVIKRAEKTNSRVYNVLGDSGEGNDESFKSIFAAAMDNMHICQMQKMKRSNGRWGRLITPMIFP